MDIEDVWRANHERVQAQKEEITRDVPTGWPEGLVDNPKKIIDPDKDYNSHAGGGVYGPKSTAFAKTTGECLAPPQELQRKDLDQLQQAICRSDSSLM
jgi:hypothetical protein